MVFSRGASAHRWDAFGRSRRVYVSAEVGVAIFSSCATENADGVGWLHCGAVSGMDDGYGSFSHGTAESILGEAIRGPSRSPHPLCARRLPDRPSLVLIGRFLCAWLQF